MARSAVALLAVLLAATGSALAAPANTTQYWLGRRAALVDSVFGLGAGVLPTRSGPDQVQRGVAPGVDALVWNLTASFEITRSARSRTAIRNRSSLRCSSKVFFFFFM